MDILLIQANFFGKIRNFCFFDNLINLFVVCLEVDIYFNIIELLTIFFSNSTIQY